MKDAGPFKRVLPVASPNSCKEQANAARLIGTPSEDDGINPAMEPYPTKRHLEDADGDIQCAVWGVMNGVRQKYQNDDK